jgi:hypothetical protein
MVASLPRAEEADISVPHWRGKGQHPLPDRICFDQDDCASATGMVARGARSATIRTAR